MTATDCALPCAGMVMGSGTPYHQPRQKHLRALLLTRTEPHAASQLTRHSMAPPAHAAAGLRAA